MTITKATASPTIRKILPSHITVKNTSTAASAAATSVNAAASGAVLGNNGKPSATANVVTASSPGAPTRPVVSMMVRAGGATTTSTLPVGQFQPIGKNNVYIRKRKNETILPADVGVKAKQGPILVNDVRPEVIVPAKRAKIEESRGVSQVASFVGPNRLGGAATITAKTTLTKDGVKGVVPEVVELE